MNRHLLLLALAQGLFLTNNVTFIAINGLVGLSLAPVGWMATLPVMGYVVGGAFSTALVAKTQHRFGRKASFQLGLGVALGSALQDVLMQIQCGSLLATAAGGGAPYDMVSRFFAPYYGVPEDPVTGSAHCALTPFWARRLGKKILKARQASPRGGDLLCTDDGARTVIQGTCALYLTGEIEV